MVGKSRLIMLFAKILPQLFLENQNYMGAILAKKVDDERSVTVQVLVNYQILVVLISNRYIKKQIN